MEKSSLEIPVTLCASSEKKVHILTSIVSEFALVRDSIEIIAQIPVSFSILLVFVVGLEIVHRVTPSDAYAPLVTSGFVHVNVA